jgi:hypothetical protein
MLMDAEQLAGGEADIELVLAGFTGGRSWHAEVRGWRAGRARRMPASTDRVFASKNPACSPALVCSEIGMG